jgi:hypothetical protein
MLTRTRTHARTHTHTHTHARAHTHTHTQTTPHHTTPHAVGKGKVAGGPGSEDCCSSAKGRWRRQEEDKRTRRLPRGHEEHPLRPCRSVARWSSRCCCWHAWTAMLCSAPTHSLAHPPRRHRALSFGCEFKRAASATFAMHCCGLHIECHAIAVVVFLVLCQQQRQHCEALCVSHFFYVCISVASSIRSCSLSLRGRLSELTPSDTSSMLHFMPSSRRFAAESRPSDTDSQRSVQKQAHSADDREA